MRYDIDEELKADKNATCELKLSKSATLEKKETSFCSPIRMKREHFEKISQLTFCETS